ncbi:hypothetical protein AB9Q04_04920 [Anaerococcus sp. ENR1011]|uniref:Uncharacterized protein n=1 Tax=Anaerococcus groningensis TaxID=3115616 RepID=A0ABW9N0W1_9FIRM
MENNILAGETVLTENMEFTWIKDVTKHESTPIEEIDFGKDYTLSLKKRISFYKYFINYLLTENYEAFGIDKKKVSEKSYAIFDAIEKNEESQELNKLVDFIADEFEKRTYRSNQLPSVASGSALSEDCEILSISKEEILADLKADFISRDRMIAYAFGLGMDIEELETFLMKVLEGTGLNIWDKKEGLAYIAFKFFPKDSLNFYIRANELYDYTGDFNKLKDVDQLASLNTVVLQNYINVYLSTFVDVERASDDLILDIIGYYKELVSQNTSRTIKTEFISSFEGIEKRLADRLEEDIADVKFFVRGKVEISYSSDKDITLGPDDKFIWRSDLTQETLIYHPYREYRLAKSPEERKIKLSLVSNLYDKKEDALLLIHKESYKNFAFVNDYEFIKSVASDAFYITDSYKDAILAYLYKKSTPTKKSYPEISEEKLALLDDLLKDTKIRLEDLSAIIENNELDKLSRDLLITVFFLDFVLNNEDKWDDYLENPTKRKRNYLIFMDHQLRNCKLYEYNTSNPYECVLLKLVVDDDPIEAFKDLWALYVANIDKKRD